ncbi:hypothetical protein F5X99DRAFT_212106 [Biscogniauxia marginata]|nr:hypothetical protein F5X99DRAFT_212106 [Biscogniauxia marginata]
MRTRPARTVARSAIASMIAQRSKTSPPTSFVACVETLAIWPAIVPIDRKALAGAMMDLVPLVASAEEMPLTANMSNSCKNLVAGLADSLPGLKLVLADLTTTAAAMRSLGNVDQLALLLLGDLATTTMVMKKAAAMVAAAPLHGVTVTEVVIAVEVITMAVETIMVARLLPVLLPAPLLGIKQLADNLAILATLAILAMVPLLAWARPLVFLQTHSVLLPDFLAISTP